MLDAAIRNNWKDIYLPKEAELEIIKNEGIDELKAFYGIDQKSLRQTAEETEHMCALG